ELKEKIAEKYNTQHQLELNQENILVTCGALESLMDIALAYINPGDEVVFHEPTFPYFGFQSILAGGKLVPISLDSSTDFKLKSEILNEKITQNTKLLMINFPTNPTAGCISHKEMKAIVEICQDAGVLLISDEVYEFITYDNYKSPSVLDFDYENIIVINSASKALCMTGMRVGYSVSPSKNIISPVAQIHQYNTAHSAVPNQLGVLKGLENESSIIDNTMEILDERRKALIEHWGKLPGVKFEIPKSTFYLYPDISESGMNSYEFSKFALEQGVVVVPGNTFCFTDKLTGGDDFVRLSYGIVSPEDIKESAELLMSGLEKLY
ncbi:MAG: pyridoxal phosphate-dependent aminotransferase, partial [Candidatus Heimdallarchaeota archaeon]